MLEELFIKSRDFININNQEYKRYFIQTQKLEHRLSVIIGSRGIGKTTTVAQNSTIANDRLNANRY